ncbi:U4/U6 small nuclear ribonucleoprotein prp4 [Tulasnella sp. JGI-2019a]|nr:U4/U6 small nuclear ribonucleoprotein prp4 [Tulasnella sp. JGI-2019a]
MSTGIKRPREQTTEDLPYGSDSDRSSTRRDVRRRDGTGARDWRDAHLNPNRDRKASYESDGSRERRDRQQRHDNRPPNSPRDRQPPYKDHRDSDRPDRGSHYGSYRGKPYEKDRAPPYPKDAHRRHDVELRKPPSGPRSSREVKPPSRDVSEGPSAGREEGEISPRMAVLSIEAPATPSTPSHDCGTHADEDKSDPEHGENDEDLSPEQIIAARRAKRQAILAKYNSSARTSSDTLPAANVPKHDPIEPELGQLPSSAQVQAVSHSAEAVPSTPESGMVTPEQTSEPPQDFSLTKDHRSGEDNNEQTSKPLVQQDSEQISAADYDPSQDRREEEMRRVKAIDARDDHTMDIDGGAGEDDEEEVEEEEDDVDDMFAIIEDKPKQKKVRKVKQSTTAVPLRTAPTVDAAADPEGYYQIILGEALDSGRYQVFSSLGKGMFSAVVRARVVNGEKDEIGKEVAIKIIRSQESMYKAGMKEAAILNKLAAADPEDKKHLIRLEKTFDHRGHLCMVFESMSMNLREVVKRFGKDIGLNMRAVRAYAHQLFLALSLMKKCNIMHADIKPDNILVNDSKAVLKVCDLGSASDTSENDITPYLVSRFYRAPEIILGLPYDTALDMWSIGCTLYELYTGKILFPGRTNNHMLLLMMELKGRFSSKMVKRAKFGDIHFDENGTFHSVEVDSLTGKELTRDVFIQKPSRDLRARLIPSSTAKSNDDETKLLLSFVDLLDKCLALDPTKRLTPRDALSHPFIRG